MMLQSPSALLILLGAVVNTLACVIPTTPLSNNITEGFSIYVQNSSLPAVHNRVLNFRPNGLDKHLVLRPAGEATGDLLFVENGLLKFEGRHAVIDLEYNPADDTTKMFMTDRTYHPSAVFQPIYVCDQDNDQLRIALRLVSRLLDPPVNGGQIGIQTAGDTYEFRYSPPNNPLLDARFFSVTMVIFRNSTSPTPPVSTTATTTASRTTTRSTTTSSTTTSSTTSRITTTTTASGTPPASTTSSSTTTTTRTTTSATPTTSGTFPAVGRYSYVSCWAEPASGARTLPSAYLNTADMTLEKCADFCSFYPYFGTQWSRECWCGDQLTAGSAAAPASDCNNRCIGDATEFCGGSRRLSLYHIDGWTGPPTPGRVGGYNWLACYTDSPRRTLNSASLSSSTMTLEMCATFCAGYKYFGTEWAIECWCGNTLTDGAAQVSLSQCSTNCGGNAKQKCGNADRLSVYQLGP